VSDDEAFIRAIVSNPGDDASRLIYADWLEEREDPRGAYLREEVRWHRVWFRRMAYHAPADELANTLDPVWVSRVTRPPFGSCVDRIRFEA
jgi:uncharacterized protein (TIGR02996 family)